MGFCDRARSGCEHSTSIAHAKRRLDKIARLLSEKVFNTVHFFYVMESKVSGNCIRNIHKPCAPDKEINRKGNTVGKIAKGRQIRKSTQA